MGTTIGSRVRFTRALRSRPFALLWIGQTISVLGDGAFYTVIAWQVVLLTGSATAMGVVMLAQAAPRIVFLLIGGVLADRLSRRLVMLLSDAGRALMVGAIAALSGLGLLQLWHLVALGLFFGLADAFFYPAYQSIVPQIVEVEALPSANSLMSIGRQVSPLAGPALGAAFITLAGPASALAFDGVTFLISALCLLFVQVSSAAPVKSDKQPGIWHDIREGLGYVLRSPWLWVSIVIASLLNIGTTPFAVVLPKLVHDVIGSGVWLLSAALVVSSIGSLLATLAIGQARRLHRRGIIAYTGLVVSSLGLIAFGAPSVLGVMGVTLPPYSEVVGVLAGAAAFGVGLGVFSIIWETVLQELIPNDMLGRVTSLDYLGSLALLPVGLGLAGVVADRIGAAQVFIAGGALNLLLALIALSVHGIRKLD